MDNKIDFSAFSDNAPIITISLSSKDAFIRVFYSTSCCKKMFEHHGRSDDYRTAFLKAVFHMYQKTQFDNATFVTESEFSDISEDSLILVLNTILEHNNQLKVEYNNAQSDDVYERFYNANKAVLKSATAGISTLVTSLSNAMRTLIVTPDYMSGSTSSMTNIAKIQSLEVESIKSKIMQPVFDIQTFAAPLQKLSEDILHINDGLSQTLQTSLLQMSKALQSVVTSIDFSKLFNLKEMSEQRETLLKFGWFNSNELPDDLVNYIHNKRDELSIESVDKLIVDYFRQDKCKELKTMVKKWNDLPYFKCRTKVFHEALVNHSRQYFISSVTLLTVHTEGVITDFVRTSLKTPRFKVEKAIEDIKKELSDNEDISLYQYEVFNDAIEQIELAFNESFKHSDPDATSNKSRHKIAHGHAFEPESEANSLKQFLYLNEVYYMFSLLQKQEYTVPI